MTNVLKKAVAAILALAMTLSAVGCSTDKTWAAKSSSGSVPIGVYIFYLYSAFTEASSKVTDTSKPVLNQKVESKDAATWIKDTAMTNLKSYMYVDAKMKELNLSLTSAEKTSATTNTTTAWNNYGTTLQNYGISQSSFDLAYSQFNAKRDKIFLTLYGKGGKNAVSDADLKTYFEKNFTDFNYIYAPFYTVDNTTGSTTPLAADKKAALKKEFDNYVTQINSGKMTIAQAAAAYKTSSKATSDPLQTVTTVLNSETSASSSTDFVKMIKNAKQGVASAAEVSNNYVLLIKNDVAKKSTAQLSNDSGRSTVLYQMKSVEYLNMIKTEAGKLSGVTINDAAINDQNPAKFVPSASSASAAAATQSK